MVSTVAYIVASLLGSQPIYDSLLERLQEKASGLSEKAKNPSGSRRKGSQKVLAEYGIRNSSPADGKLVSEISWPERCLLVSIQRGDSEIIPGGSTRLQAGDIIVVMMDECDETIAYERLEEICRETMG